MIRRPPRSTRVRSSAASDVYKRQDQGCTEFGDGTSQFGFKTFDGPILWRGSIWHRGGENKSDSHARLVLFFTFDNSENDLAIEDNLPFV